MAFPSSTNNTKQINREFIIKTIAGSNGAIPMFSANGLIETLVYRTTANTDTDTSWLSTVGWVTNNFPKLSSGKIPESYLPDSIVGQVEYKGVWNASTNSPALVSPPATTTKGHYYIVNTAGIRFSIDFQVGDWIISDGAAWSKVDNTDAVTSINTMLGAISIQAGTNISVTSSNGVITIGNTFSLPTGLAYLANTQTFTGVNTFNAAVVLGTQATGTTHAVRADRTITAGTGLSGGGNLTADRTLSLDLTYADARYQASGSYVTTNTTQSITGAKEFLSTITFNNMQTGTPASYPSANHGFRWLISSDQAGMRVYERGSDALEYEFFMADNPNSVDRFVFKNTDWTGQHGALEGLSLYVGNRLENNQNLVNYGNVTVKGTPTLGIQLLPNRVDTTQAAQAATIIRNNQAFWNPDLGTSTLDMSVDVTGYTGTVSVSFLIKIKNATATPNTFCWGNAGSAYTYDVNDATKWVGNDIPVSTDWITLNNGVKIKFNATTGGVANETLGFRVLPAGDLVAERNIYEGGQLLSTKYSLSSHTHSNATTAAHGFMSSTDKTKLDGIAVGANNYSHPTTDGNLHVPATGTTNNLKVLKAGATAGTFAWGNVAYSELTGVPTTFTPSAHTHSEYLEKVGGTVSGNLTVQGTLNTQGVSLSLGEGLMFTSDNNYYGVNMDARIIRMIDGNDANGNVDGGLVIQGQSFPDGVLKEVMSIRTNGELTYLGNQIWHVGNLTGAASSVLTSNLTPSRAVVSDTNGKLVSSSATVTEVGYLIGVTSAIQTQLNAKSDTSHTHSNATTSVHGFMSSGDKTKLDGVATGANNYSHPTGDGNLHVPATGTTNNLKVLKAGATAGTFAWGNVAYGELTGIPSTFAPSAHSHAIADVTGLQTALNNKSETTHTHAVATTSVAGFMSASDKTAVDNLATNYVTTNTTQTITGLKTIQGNLTMTGSIIPSANITYDLGSPTRMWKDVYIGPGSLYINGKKVIEDVSDTINITTTLDQNLTMKTSGIGTLQIASVGSGNIELIAGTGLIQLKGSVMIQSDKLLRTHDGGSLKVDDDIQFSAGTGISGSLRVTSLAGTGSRMVIADADGLMSTQAIYLHPTGDGNLHVPATSTTNNNKVLKAGATAGTISWGNVAYSELTGVPSTFTPTAHTHAITDVTGLQTALNAKEDKSNRGIANGYAPLDGNSKVPTTHLPDVVLGQVEYMGTWNASTNTPTLPATPTKKGDYYVVSAAGTRFSISFEVGDWIISNGSAWEKVDNTDAVTSVHGRIGAVVSANGDYTASQVTNVPYGNIAALTVQAAINELDDEKAPVVHSHSDATTSAAGFMSAADKTKLNGVATGANNYSHPTGDGNLHVIATGTTNNGKFLMAGATAGSLSWGTPANTTYTAGTGLTLTDTVFSNNHTTLTSLTDTAFASLADNQLLKYNAGTLKWENWTMPTYMTSYTETDTLASVTGRGATTATALSLTNATHATTAATGALVVTGGVGIGGNSVFGGTVDIAGKLTLTSDYMLYDNKLNVIVQQSASATTSNRLLSIGNGTYNRYWFKTGQLVLGATEPTTHSGYQLDVAGTTRITGATTIGGATGITGNLAVTGDVNVSSTGTEANLRVYRPTTSNYIGLRYVAGVADLYHLGSDPVRIFQNGVVAQTFETSGFVSFVPPMVLNSTTEATSTTTGSFKTAGGIGVAKNAYIGGNVGVTGSVTWSSGSGVTHGSPTTLAIGYSGGNYGGLGYGIGYTATSNQHTFQRNDSVSWLEVGRTGGITLYGYKHTGTAVTIGSNVTWTEVLRANIDDFRYKGQTVWHTGIFNGALSGLTDANISTPIVGHLLRYDGSVWRNWIPNYLTSYTETDTLATVTGRGNTTGSVINITNATASTSKTTGALIVSGGVGIGGSVYANALYDNGARVLTSYSETDTLASVTGRGATTATALSLTNATDATSKTTGALVVTGGIGVGGTVRSETLTAININQLGYDFTLGTADQTGRGNSGASRALVKALLNSQAGLYINYNNDYTGGTSIGGNVYVPATTASTSTSTGAMVVSGGVGVAGSLYAAAIYDNGLRVLTSYTETSTLAAVTGRGATTATAISITNNTSSTSNTTGALVVTGGIGLSGHINTSANVYASQIYTTATNGRGFGFWSSDSYKIYMSAANDGTWGGKLDTTSDYNMYFRMSGGVNRGFVFENGTGINSAVAQIDSTGNLYAKGTVFAKVDSTSIMKNGTEKFVDYNNFADSTILYVDDIPATEITKLVDPANWTGHQYTGSPLVNCLQGTEYDDGFHLYRFVQDNVVRRMQYV